MKTEFYRVRPVHAKEGGPPAVLRHRLPVQKGDELVIETGGKTTKIRVRRFVHAGVFSREIPALRV